MVWECQGLLTRIRLSLQIKLPTAALTLFIFDFLPRNQGPTEERSGLIRHLVRNFSGVLMTVVDYAFNGPLCVVYGGPHDQTEFISKNMAL